MEASAGKSPASAGSPTSSAMASPPRLSDEEVRVARFSSAALLLGSGIVAIYSVFTVWWKFTATGLNTQYFPGPSFKTNGTFHSYASVGLGPVGGLFDAILALGIVAGILLLVAGAILFLAAARRRASESRVPAGLGIAGTVLEAVSLVVPVAMLPWAFHDSSAGSTYCSAWTGASPCSMVWGSGTQGGIGYNFVLADGWIIMTGALALGVLGLVIWRLGRSPP
jgi:hypothetical protein